MGVCACGWVGARRAFQFEVRNRTLIVFSVGVCVWERIREMMTVLDMATIIVAETKQVTQKVRSHSHTLHLS